MGYTTKFEGSFTLSKPASAEAVLRLRDIAETDYRDEEFPTGAPASWLQWVLSRDRTLLSWDGTEKFYEYAEWLQWLVDNVFAPEGITLSGSLKYSGEKIDDVGTLGFDDDDHGGQRVVKIPAVFRDRAEP